MLAMWTLIKMAVLLICAIDDIKHKEINLIVLLGGVIVLAGSCVIGGTDITCMEVVVSIIPGLAVLVISKLAKGIGEGDGYMCVFTSLFYGISHSIDVFSMSFLLAGLYALLKKIKNKNSDPVAFAPFLLVGVIICDALFFSKRQA